MSTLSTYLAHVAVSAKAQGAFEADPASAMKSTGLTAAAKAAVLSKDPAKIRDTILAEKGIQVGGAAMAGDTEIVIVVVL